MAKLIDKPPFMPCTGLREIRNKEGTYFSVCSVNQLDYMRNIGLIVVGDEPT